jgi:hypothetical protein
MSELAGELRRVVVQEGGCRHRRTQHDINVLKQRVPSRPQPAANATRVNPVRVAHRQAALEGGSEALIFERERFSGGCNPFARFGGQVRATKGRQQLAIDPRCLREIGHLRALAQDLAAKLSEAIGEAVERRHYALCRGAERVRVDHQYPEIRQFVVPRRGQREFVADAFYQFVRAGHDRQLQRQIGRAARHRPNHGQIATHWDRQRLRRAAAPDRGSACGRRHRTNVLDSAASRRYPSRILAARNRRRALPPNLPTIRQGCG